MGLYKQWQELMEGQTDETFSRFWEKYSGTEKRIYSDILDHPQEKFTGQLNQLVEKYQADPVIFMGFLDGIQSSLKQEQILDAIHEDSKITLDIDYEKLFFNILAADAEYLYTLPQWTDILGEDKMAEIEKAYKKSKTVVKEKRTGRNKPCPCGSGKKYKHCCGRNG